jgi:type II secretory pathway pseudopilin PulG
MERALTQKGNQQLRTSRTASGFTIPEVIIAGTIMIILCVGTLTVFSYVVKINRGNNLRMQALSVLQAKVEYYRSLKFVPGQETIGDLPNHRVSDLYAGTHTLTPITTPDDRQFQITAVVTNAPPESGANDEANCEFKTIVITAVPVVAETEGWLQNLQTNVTIQRVRSN